MLFVVGKRALEIPFYVERGSTHRDEISSIDNSSGKLQERLTTPR